MQISEWKMPIWQCYICKRSELYDILKRHNYGDSKDEWLPMF